MRTMTVIIDASDRVSAWGEHLLGEGFERDQFENKYRKRVVTWEKDGVEYTASTQTAGNGDLIITLTEYTEKGKRTYK